MILHIAPDDKFIDMAYKMFEEVSPKTNEFLIITNKSQFKYIKTTPITKISPLKCFNKKFIKSLQKYEFVVFHGLDFFKMRLLLKANKDTKFVWIGWGVDYYDYIKSENKPLLKPKTLELLNAIMSRNNFSKKFVTNLIKKSYFFNKRDIRAINRINYFAPVLENEFELMKNSIENFNPQFIDWNYGTLEDDLIKEELAISGKNILLGNSASYENNHIEAIDLFTKLNLNGIKIICPLSYGQKDYANEIISYGKKKLGEKFEVLRSFIPIEQYNKTISTCSVVVMNHLRQQAVGNIVIMMYFGAKIFLDKKNPVYDFFINNGAVIFSMEELSSETINTKLTEKEKNQNKEVLKKFWSKDILLKKTQNLIKIMRDLD